MYDKNPPDNGGFVSNLCRVVFIYEYNAAKLNYGIFKEFCV